MSALEILLAQCVFAATYEAMHEASPARPVRIAHNAARRALSSAWGYERFRLSAYRVEVTRQMNFFASEVAALRAEIDLHRKGPTPS